MRLPGKSCSGVESFLESHQTSLLASVSPSHERDTESGNHLGNVPINLVRREDCMAKHIRDLMTPNPVTLSAASTLVDAAIAMRDFDVGAVIVVENGQIYGIATDRDIVVRAIANGNYPATTSTLSN
jgi:CBS domain